MFLINLWIKLQISIKKVFLFFSLFFIFLYKSFFSTVAASGGCCRFYPSCSDYALIAYKNYPFLKASFLVLQSLWDCRPFGPKLRREPLFTELEEVQKSLFKKREKNAK